MGDIDCWGFESEPSLLDRKEQLKEQINFIDEFHTSLETLEEKGMSDIKNIPREEKLKIISSFKSLLKYICVRNQLLREKLTSLEKSEIKFRKLGDDWRHSKYYPVICSIRVSIVDIKKLVEEGLSYSKTTLFYGAAVQGSQHIYSKSDIVVMKHQGNYMPLNENFATLDSRFQQQKTDTWFQIRKRAAVTGSTLNAALGLSTLKKQKEHYDSVILNIEKPKPDKETQERMDFGNAHEIDAIATIVSRILPFYYPHLKYFEEGCLKVPYERNESFLVVSPDGSFRQEETSLASMMYENKCKAPTSYSPYAYYSIPSYYVTQLLSEMYAYNCKELLFSCWSKQSTTVFHVTFHQELWDKCWKEAVDIYGSENSRNPTRLSNVSKDLKDALKGFITSNVTLLAEVPSCTAHLIPNENQSNASNAYVKPTHVSKDLELVSLSDVRESLVAIGKWLNEVYNALRTVASEILVFMLNDLDRYYQFEFNNSHPIAYALKGPSMTVDVLRKMTDTVIKMCEDYGMQIVVTASDGQWHNYGIRDVKGNPLTCHQLHRDHWREVRSKDKASLISTIRNMYKISSANDIVMESLTEQYLPLTRCMQDKKVLPTMWNKIVVHGHAKEKQIMIREWPKTYGRQSTLLIDNAEVVNGPPMNPGCLDGDFQDDLDDETLARIDEVYSGVQSDETFQTTNKTSLQRSGEEMCMNNSEDALQLGSLFGYIDDSMDGNVYYSEESHVSEQNSIMSSQNNDNILSNTLSEAYGTLYGSHYDLQENEWNSTDYFINEDAGTHALSTTTDQSYCWSHESDSNDMYAIDTIVLPLDSEASHSMHEKCMENDNMHTTDVMMEECDVAIEEKGHEENNDDNRDKSGEQNEAFVNIGGNSSNSDAFMTMNDYQTMNTSLCEDIKCMDIRNWRNISFEKFISYFMTKDTLKRHFQKYELSCCLSAISDMLNSRKIKFNVKWQKYRMVDFFTEFCSHKVSNDNNNNNPGIMNTTHSKSKPKPLLSLKKLCMNEINKWSKITLATIVAEHTWEKTFQDWQRSAPIPSSIGIEGVNENIQWFTQPSIGPDNKVRFHFTDACHILTCIRTKLCTTGIAGLNRKAWEEAALSSETQLNISVVIECVDKQDVSLARRMFGIDVEKAMGDQYKKEALFCCLIRQWFDSEDEPSIPAFERCRHRLRLRDWLLEGYEIGRFPPVTQYVRGIPIITYEALVSHTERKMQLHAFIPGGKYNVRATGSQEVEQFFSTFRDMDPSGKGTPKPDTIPEMMTAVAEIDNYRLNPNRPFLMRTSRAAVYPLTKMSVNKDGEEVERNEETFIRDEINAKNLQLIIPRNHFFDKPERDSRKHKRKSGRISQPEESAHGEMGVRQFHARDDSKILAHLRKGMLDVPDI